MVDVLRRGRLRPTTGRGSTTGPGPRSIALLVGRVLLAAFYLVVGASKLTGAEAAVEMFDEIGMGDWLRLTVGALEVAGGLLLLVRRAVVVAAVGLVVVMAGAVLTQVVVFGGRAAAPAVLLGLLVGLAWLHRDQKGGDR